MRRLICRVKVKDLCPVHHCRGGFDPQTAWMASQLSLLGQNDDCKQFDECSTVEHAEVRFDVSNFQSVAKPVIMVMGRTGDQAEPHYPDL